MAQNPTQARMYLHEQNLLDSIKLFLPDLAITIHDLRNPSVEIVSRFYNAFLEELGVNTTNLLQIQMNQMTLISHVDMYNATVPMLNQFQSISYFLSNVGINDFNVSDLVNPTPKRTVIHFNALMNFLTYCDERIGSLQPELQKVAELRNNRDELLSKIELLRSDINKRATDRVKRREKIKELQSMGEKDKEKLDEVMHEKEIQTNALNGIKKLNDQDAEKEAQLIRVIKNTEEEIEKLKSMIVKSPEKLKTDLEELERKKRECAKAVESCKIQIEEKKKLIEQMSQDRDKQEARHKKLTELVEIKMMIQEKHHENGILGNECSQLQEEIEELKQNNGNQRLKRESLLAAFEELKSRKEKQDSEKKDFLQAANKELNNLISKKKERETYIDAIQMQINELLEDIEKVENEYEKYLTMYRESHQRMCVLEDQLIQDYMEVLDKVASGHGRKHEQ